MAYQATVRSNRRRYVVGKAEPAGEGFTELQDKDGRRLERASLAHHACVAFQALRQPNRCILSAQRHFAMCPAEAFRRKKQCANAIHEAHQAVIEADGTQIMGWSSLKFRAKLVVNSYNLLEAAGGQELRMGLQRGIRLIRKSLGNRAQQG